jgi:Ca2+-binding RTX toxin-like protein
MPGSQKDAFHYGVQYNFNAARVWASRAEIDMGTSGQLVVERIEAWRLLSVSVNHAGICTVNANPGGSEILAEAIRGTELIADHFAVSVDGEVTSLLGQIIHGFRILGSDSKDSIHFTGPGDLTRAHRNTIHGGAGNDNIVTSMGSDRVYGDEGDDSISTSGGVDRIYAGAGDDMIDAGAGSDKVHAGDGNDIVKGGVGHDRIFGDAGRDQLGGGSQADQIDGGADADKINGGNGNDTIRGGAGSDLIHGNSGDDRLASGGGDDSIFGNRGSDTLLADDGANFLSGGQDNDLIYAGDGNDILQGDGGDDDLDGEAGTDQITGGDGNDDFYPEFNDPESVESTPNAQITDLAAEDTGHNAILSAPTRDGSIGGGGAFQGGLITGGAVAGFDLTSTVLTKYTYVGDSALDGVVNSLDFNALASNFSKPSAAWLTGDFNYDGAVNALDFNMIANYFGPIPPQSPSGG